MLVDNTKNAVLEDTDISEVVRVKLTGEDYLKFNQLIPNLVLQKKIPDSAKKSYVSALGVQCFIQIMNVVTMAGKKFVHADADAILTAYVNKSSHDEAYKKLVKAITGFKVNEDGSVQLSAKQHEDLLAIANIAIHSAAQE